MKKMAEKQNMPVEKFRAGAVSAAIWKNTMELKDGKKIDSYSVTLDKRYKDKDGKWKSSKSIQVNEIPKALLVLGKAYDYIVSMSKDIEETVEEEVVM